jgi:hypothetical protein
MPKGKKGGVNKLDTVRQIIQRHGKEVMPADIVKLAKEEHKVDLNPDVASNYKSLALKQLGLGGVRKGKRGRKPAPKPASVAAANGAKHAPQVSKSGGISIEDIEAVKKLVDRMGAEKVRQLAGVLAR